MRLVFYVLLLVIPSIVAATPIRVQKNFSAVCPKGTTFIAQCGVFKGRQSCTREINIVLGDKPNHRWGCKNGTRKPCPVKLLLCENIRKKFVLLYRLSKVAARKAELAQKAAARKAELAQKAAARKAELARKAAARKARVQKGLTVKEVDAVLLPCQKPSITEVECGQGRNALVCEYKVNIDLGKGIQWSCDGNKGDMCPIALRLCSESKTRFTLYTLKELQKRKALPPKVILTEPKPKPFRFSFDYDQIRIPKNANDSVLGGFMFPIIATDAGFFGLDLGLGHSLERNLYTRVGLVYDYRIAKYFEIGTALDVTIIPGGEQDEASVYYWSAGARLRAALVLPTTFRPSLGVSFGYAYGRWETIKRRSLTQGVDCELINACQAVAQHKIQEGGVWSVNPSIFLQVPF